MIEPVLSIVRLDHKDQKVKLHDTPADHNKIFDNNSDGEAKKQRWNYRSAVSRRMLILLLINYSA